MAPPNIPADFDFLDPDVNLAGLPVDELAELRKAEPVHWVDVPGGTGGFEDKGYWLVTKHADVKEVSRRSDVFSSWQNGAIPTWPKEMTRENVELQRSVMLNMDAPHHTRLRKIISRGFTPRAIGRLEEELAQRAQNIAKTAAAEGTGDFVEQVSLRAAAAGHRRTARRAPGRPRQAVPLVQRDDRRRGPRVRRRRPGAVVDGTDHVRDGHGRRAGQEPDRRHRHDADPGRHRRREALRRRVRLLRDHARGGGQRDHPQLDHSRHDRVLAEPRPVGALQEGAPVDHGRRDHPLGHPGIGVPAHRPRGRRAGRRDDQEGPARGDVLPLGQLRRRGLRTTRTHSTSCATRIRTSASAAPAPTTASARTWPG